MAGTCCARSVYVSLTILLGFGLSEPAWAESVTTASSEGAESLGPDLRGVAIVVDAPDAADAMMVDTLTIAPTWRVEGNQVGADFALSVASAGDVNGDGYSDVIVGQDGYTNGQIGKGRVLVYHGSPAGLATTADWTAEGDQIAEYFGASAETAGDINGDGYSDVIVGAILYDNGQTSEGGAFVYLGSAAGLATSPAWTAEGDQASAELGYAVATAGDVNADGFSDVIVGAPFHDNGESDEGRAYVYLGSASGLATTPAWTAEGDQASALFGAAVATAGDVNGDGYSDVIVSAGFYDNGQSDEGRVYVYHGSASGLSTSAAWRAEGNQTEALLVRVGSAGDVNGDGYGDVIVGAYAYDNQQKDEGRAYVYLGSASGLSTSPAWTAEGNQVGAAFADPVAGAGDFDGDGYGDVIVGAYLYDNGQQDEGRAFVYYGSASGLSTSPAWTAESDQESAFFGYPVATAGDVNGDGFADVIVGAYQYGNDQNHEGAAFVYHGFSSSPATGAGRVVDAPQLLVAKAAGAQITLTWGASCLATDHDYEVYEGTIGGNFTSHRQIFCSTSGTTEQTLAPSTASMYYLIVPRNDAREGSYGTNSSGAERPQGETACLPREIGSCP